MKKTLRTILLLFFGLHLQAQQVSVTTETELSNAFLTAQSGSIIQLQSDIAVTTTLWLGTESMGTSSADGYRTLTLDLNGHTLVRAQNVRLMDITHGELIITTSVSGGMITDNASAATSSLADLILVCGSTLKDVNPRTSANGYYSHLIVTEEVSIQSQLNTIVVDVVSNATGHNIQYGTEVYSYSGQGNNRLGVAHGVRVDVYGRIVAQKYGVKCNGLLLSPTTNGTDLQQKNPDSQYEDYEILVSDTAYAPYFYVHSTASIVSDAVSTKAVALYASGYARWRIEGEAEGNTGLFIKSGDVEVIDATIVSTGTEHVSSSSQYSGVNCSGSAIVIGVGTTDRAMASLYIGGDATIIAEAGYAIEEDISQSDDSATNYIPMQIIIDGGNLQGGLGAILVSNATVVTINSTTAIPVKIGDLYYNLDWDNLTAEVTYQTTDWDNHTYVSGALQIPAMVTYQENLYTVTRIGEEAFRYCQNITSVELPNSITSIGSRAFSDCLMLDTIDIPSSVTEIETYAFYECPLFYIHIPNTAVQIDDYAFGDTSPFTIICEATTPPSCSNTAFDNIYLDTCILYVPAESVTAYRADSVWGQLFTHIRAIGDTTEVTPVGPDTITVAQAIEIGAALEVNTSTSEVYVIRGYVSAIHTAYHETYQNQSFYVTDDSTSMASSTAEGAFLVYRGKPSTEAAVSEGAWVEFSCAIKNYNGTIENGDQNIMVTVLRDAPSCRTVAGTCGDSVRWTLSCEGELHISGSGAMYDYATRPEAPFRGLEVTSVTIDEGITYIGRFCFYGCTMPMVTIPASVCSISATAFNSCPNLTHIDVAVANTHYGSIDGVLYDKNGTVVLRFPTGRSGAYTIPFGVTTIGQGAFNACNGLTEVTIPTSVTVIEGGAFYACPRLTTIELPDSITSIGAEAFAWCDSLTAFTCRATTPPTCDTLVFDGMATDSCILYVPALSVSLYQVADEWKAFAHIEAIPGSVLIIENPVLIDGLYYNLDTVNMTAEVTHETVLSSENYSNIRGSIDIQDSITYYSVKYRVTAIGDNAFQNSPITSIRIPNSINKIGSGAFGGCSRLTSIIIPNTVTIIEERTFLFCNHLTSIYLPNSITNIRNEAFSSCTQLDSITCEATLPPICGINVFGEFDSAIPGLNTSTCILYVPAESVTAYKTDSLWGTFTHIRAIGSLCKDTLIRELITICEGNDFTWHGMQLTQSGDYTDTLQNSEGCDSVCILHLTVNPTYRFSETATICEGETYTWRERTLTKTGTYRDTLQTIDGCDSILVLQLTVNPSYHIEEIVSIREDKLPYKWQGRSLTEAGNYTATYETVNGCDSTITLQLTVTELPIYQVNVLADHGHVNGTGTYPEGTRIFLTAVPDEGFEFQMWSDGTTTNPKDFTVMQDTTFRALFYMPEVEQQVVVDSIETNSVTITWDTVPGATLYELRVYKNGELIVTLQIDADNNIINTTFNGPDRLIARKDSTGGSSETLQVEVSGLEPGQDYTYSLDALDDERSYVGAQSGSFTTEEEPINGLEQTETDWPETDCPRKVLREGRLYILLPDGTAYDARGVPMEN